MLIRNFDVRKLVGAVWDEAQLGFDDCEDPTHTIEPVKRLDFWKVTGIPAPDEAEHNDNKQEEKF